MNEHDPPCPIYYTGWSKDDPCECVLIARVEQRERIRQHIQTMYDEARSSSERGSRSGVDSEVVIWFDRQVYSLGKVLEWLDV